ncbi:hypothetical protein LZ31DRAFT_14439 [Colletotrichum somersetense]|nr:hypothetical protein LZ31DRAFT_14439 [Colletotrichum somersetense]
MGRSLCSLALVVPRKQTSHRKGGQDLPSRRLKGASGLFQDVPVRHRRLAFACCPGARRFLDSCCGSLGSPYRCPPSLVLHACCKPLDNVHPSGSPVLQTQALVHWFPWAMVSSCLVDPTRRQSKQKETHANPARRPRTMRSHHVATLVV